MLKKLDTTAPPAPGETIEIAPGILWVRFALPFALNHVNIYLVEDGDGWAVIDTGLGDSDTMESWNFLLNGPLKGRPLTRIIGTHYHPDHIGLVGWMVERFDIPIYMTIGEYLLGLHYGHKDNSTYGDNHKNMYIRHGMEAGQVESVIGRGHNYRKLVTGLPDSYHRLVQGDVLDIGGRSFEIFTGGGHAPEQAMLFNRDEGIFLAADQILTKITPNISVSAMDPKGDPLGLYLRSLKEVKQSIPDGVLVLPGHQQPFVSLHNRIDELAEHHEMRCQIIEDACRNTAKTAAELVPLLFKRPLDDHQMTFAFTEALAHVNMMIEQKRLIWAETGNVWRATTA